MLDNKVLRYLFFALLIFFSSCSSSDRFRSRHSQNYYAYKYKGRLMSAQKQCDRIVKKKSRKRRKPIFAWNSGGSSKKSSSSTALAEVDPNDTPPPPKPKPKPKPQPKAEVASDEEKLKERMHGETFEELSLEEKHTIEDEVLKENNIPPPSSEEHERIRKEVEDRIANDNFPQDLEPLYFLHDDDEFSVVDMEPFLVAVEYALQGRMILIEGHTDASGRDDYNVKLSIQRVEKIRQLMHDMGVPDDRISVIGYGEEKADSQAVKDEKSRRVDFKVF